MADFGFCLRKWFGLLLAIQILMAAIGFFLPMMANPAGGGGGGESSSSFYEYTGFFWLFAFALVFTILHMFDIGVTGSTGCFVCYPLIAVILGLQFIWTGSYLPRLVAEVFNGSYTFGGFVCYVIELFVGCLLAIQIVIIHQLVKKCPDCNLTKLCTSYTDGADLIPRGNTTQSSCAPSNQ